MILIFDNYDSFTFNLCDYLKQAGQEICVIRNDEKSLEEIEQLDFSAIVLSPGPGTPENSGILMALIEKWYQRVPILGICLGHQALGLFFGASLQRAKFPMHGKVSKIKALEHPMWDHIPQVFSVCRYHSLVLKINHSQYLEVTAYSEDDHEIMAFSHKSLPIRGIQFHPEAILTEYGMQILINWLNAFTLH